MEERFENEVNVDNNQEFESDSTGYSYPDYSDEGYSKGELAALIAGGALAVTGAVSIARWGWKKTSPARRKVKNFFAGIFKEDKEDEKEGKDSDSGKNKTEEKNNNSKTK